jgi:vacuolar-type H+-ATPase subunit E/Vma4
MDRKGEILQQKLKWANRVFEEAGKRMAEMSRKGGPEYRELLAQLILEGIAKMKGNRFIVELSSRDSEAVRKQLKTILERAKKTKNEKIELQIRTLSTMGLGGVIISTQDMTQYYNNTLEARLSNARQNLSGEVYRMMFKRGE